jgi:hypothetical protein
MKTAKIGSKASSFFQFGRVVIIIAQARPQRLPKPNYSAEAFLMP